VERELREETGLMVRAVELIEALERIFSDSGEIRTGQDAARVPSTSQEVTRTLGVRPRPRYHYVILDYLCERVSGEPKISAEISDLAFVREEDLAKYVLTPAATRVLRKAFAMIRARPAR
jgi:ADP-ribose pyrophosphatase YjhB (NUDIX family)